MNSQQVFIALKALNQAKVRSTVHLKGFNGAIHSGFFAFFLFGIRY
ncbi:hypothetical protein LEP1GSC087_4079 [Leptospira interrogans serovar Bataviae str. L1111]|nr:hypothetical protein LEP1GSC069_1492 [Leptospira interrogans serovar Canicola str. Fiocruz LV133]EKO68718.1 hypothetical protein LEP1GSC069_3104 [Leptospira interrogans serovar Canicola str. Fiocruz LV133]EKO70169.1 hypothetical protein LEP1GSC069_2817 [Leptospira interrogans serovar Canicola str. Fiocruz LV133]EKR26354.1 hypothetical protein LEP1GSC087_4079 [Leptospira interrogans serovar Bataviae str. L1111]